MSIKGFCDLGYEICAVDFDAGVLLDSVNKKVFRM